MIRIGTSDDDGTQRGYAHMSDEEVQAHLLRDGILEDTDGLVFGDADQGLAWLEIMPLPGETIDQE